MTFSKESIGDFMGITIYHGSCHLSFEDYDEMFMKVRGKKPLRYEVYTSSQERGRDYMLGFDIIWDDKTERMSFEEFWKLYDRNTDWGCNEERIGGWYDGNGVWVERYSTLSWKYTEVVFQTHSSGACPFDRVSGKPKMFDYFGAREYLENLKKCG